MDATAAKPVSHSVRRRFADYVAEHAPNAVKTALLAGAIGHDGRPADVRYFIERLQHGVAPESMERLVRWVLQQPADAFPKGDFFADFPKRARAFPAAVRKLEYDMGFETRSSEVGTLREMARAVYGEDASTIG